MTTWASEVKKEIKKEITGALLGTLGVTFGSLLGTLSAKGVQNVAPEYYRETAPQNMLKLGQKEMQ